MGDARDILEDVVSVKTFSEIFYVEFYSSSNYSYVPAVIQSERANYPFGRCFNVQTVVPYRNESIVSVSINIHANQTVRVYFSDKTNDATAIR